MRYEVHEAIEDLFCVYVCNGKMRSPDFVEMISKQTGWTTGESYIATDGLFKSLHEKYL